MVRCADAHTDETAGEPPASQAARLEVLDGRQHITSLGRFLTKKFAIRDHNGKEQYFDSLSEDKQNKILNTKLLVYECTGSESDIKEWFKNMTNCQMLCQMHNRAKGNK